MPQPPKFPIVLIPEETAELESLAMSALNARVRKRAAIVLLLASGATQQEIARLHRTSQSRVSIIARSFSNDGRMKWITHFLPIGPPPMPSEVVAALKQKYLEGKAEKGHLHSLRYMEFQTSMSYGTRRNALRRAG